MIALLKPKVRLRPARPRDADGMAGILSGWIDATPWMPRIHTLEEDRWFAGHLIEEMAVTVAVDRRGRVLGFLARREHFVHALYLAEDARGQGIGARLIAAAKAESPHLELWTFAANTGAQAFYAREGFAVAEAGDGSGNDEGLPDLRLEWRADEQRRQAWRAAR